MYKKPLSSETSNSYELPLLSEHRNNKKNAPKGNLLDSLNLDSSSSKYIKDMSWPKFITFHDMWSFIKTINRKTSRLEINELPLPFDFCNVDPKIIAVDSEWTKELSAHKKPSLVKALLKAYKKESLLISVIAFLLINAKIASSLLMGSIISDISAKETGNPLDYDQLLSTASLLLVVAVMFVFLNTWYWHYTAIVAATMRNTIIGFVYKKLQNVAFTSLQEVNIGKVINLLSNDVNEFDKNIIYLMPLLLSPYTIGLSGILIWRSFGFSTIFSILGLVGLLVLSNYLSKKTQRIRSEKSVVTDERIKLTNELIESIRLIKMYAWEKVFKRTIQAIRVKEVEKLLKLKRVGIIGSSFVLNSSQVSLLIMCLVYTLLDGGVLSTQKIYTALMILNFVSIWGVQYFHYGIMFVATFRVMRTRIEDILFIKEVTEPQEKNIKLSSSDNKLSKKAMVRFQDFSAWWKDKESTKPCLDDINLTLQSGQLTTVIGTIGSGKTTFLLSLLREIPCTKGSLSLEGTLAYVEQEPVIFSGTIRSNILFGLDYDEALYERVIRACNLQVDFKQSDNEDLTPVGEKGITLSGGQKARISLARALYSQSDIYLLDDPLSAVDSRVGRHLFNYAIKGDLLKDKTVILVTHHLGYAKESDRVLLFSDGKIIADGNFNELTSAEDSSLFNKIEEIKVEIKKASEKKSTAKAQEENKPEKKVAAKQEKPAKGDEGSVQVTWSTYINYVKQSGSFLSIGLVLLIYLSHGGLAIGFSRLMGYWGQAHNTYYLENSQSQVNDFDNTPYVLLTSLLVVLLISIEVIKTLLVNKILVQANSNMHNKALKALAKACTRFFDHTTIGTILNRFSNDLGVLDNTNLSLLPGVFSGFVNMILRFLALIIFTPPLLIPIIVIGVVLIKIRGIFRKPIMETKRLDLASKSPVFSEISATINGLLAIRVFRQGGTFIKKFSGLLYNNIRACLYVDRTLRFFGFAMSASFELLTISGTFTCILMTYYTNMNSTLFGLILLILQEIASFSTWVIRMSLLVDINMQSAERITKYFEIEPEAPKHKPQVDNKLQNNWPTQGQITFNNVYMKYGSDLDYVLRGLNFHITPCQKIGVVGRTGAGKSSIIQTLFRMTEIENIPGSSIDIDGVNISTMGSDLLRNSLSIIPQTPVIFTGKIRRNLDPLNKYTDSEIWQALQEVNLKDLVESMKDKLDTDMTMSSSVFSAGQKQLICLARAILKKSKIIVLDEATANVDIETDDFIQRKIMEKFQDCTVITIAHRLITIANYDKVLVIDGGKAVEYDHPYLLLVEKNGDKSIKKTGGVFASMVKNSGEDMARKIFQVAMNKYEHSEQCK